MISELLCVNTQPQLTQILNNFKSAIFHICSTINNITEFDIFSQTLINEHCSCTQVSSFISAKIEFEVLVVTPNGNERGMLHLVRFQVFTLRWHGTKGSSSQDLGLSLERRQRGRVVPSSLRSHTQLRCANFSFLSAGTSQITYIKHFTNTYLY